MRVRGKWIPCRNADGGTKGLRTGFFLLSPTDVAVAISAHRWETRDRERSKVWNAGERPNVMQCVLSASKRESTVVQTLNPCTMWYSLDTRCIVLLSSNLVR